MNIGKILDKFKSGEITKQEAVTKLQKNRNRHSKLFGTAEKGKE